MATIIVFAVVLLLVALVTVYVVKEKKKGKTSCGTCSGCAMRGSCHQQH